MKQKWLKALASVVAVTVVACSLPFSAFAAKGEKPSDIHVKNVPDKVASVTVHFENEQDDVTLTLRKGNQFSGANLYDADNKEVVALTLNWANGMVTELKRPGESKQDPNGDFYAGEKGNGVFNVWIIGEPGQPEKPDVPEQDEYALTIRYYKDAVTNTEDEENFLGEALVNMMFIVGNTYEVRIGNEPTRLDYLRPVGYLGGVQQGAVPYPIVAIDNNVINVLYESDPNYVPPEEPDEQYAVTVRYYKDAVTNVNDANYLGSLELGKYDADDEITLTPAQLAEKKLADYKDGVQTGSIPYVVVEGTNIINVVYEAEPVVIPPEQYAVTVRYYKDAVTNVNDANYLGSLELGKYDADDEITLIPAQLAEKKLADYKDGVQVGSTPYVVVKGENVINVLYEKEPVVIPPEEQYAVTVRYYKDAVTNVNDANYLGSLELGKFDVDAKIVLTLEQLNTMKPLAYSNGFQQGSKPYVVVKDAANIINVLYLPEENIEDEEPPLVGPGEDSKPEGPTVDLGDEDLPLAGPSDKPGANGTVDLEDEELPLAPPKTGDATNAAALAAIFTLAAVSVVLLKRKNAEK